MATERMWVLTARTNSRLRANSLSPEDKSNLLYASSGDLVSIGTILPSCKNITASTTVPSEKRYVGPVCSLSFAIVEKMSDDDFATWQKKWSLGRERSLARLTPAGRYDKTISAGLDMSRALYLSETKEEFLKFVNKC